MRGSFSVAVPWCSRFGSQVKASLHIFYCRLAVSRGLVMKSKVFWEVLVLDLPIAGRRQLKSPVEQSKAATVQLRPRS